MGITKEVNNMRFVNLPNACPTCHLLIDPVYVFYFNIQSNQYAVFRCSNSDCEKPILYEFDRTPSSSTLHFKQIIRGTALKTVFNETIRSISKQFSVIYNEAEFAEFYGLSEVCGMGYRKALEFLIKDYLIEKFPDDTEKIKDQFLKDCIKNYQISDHIKTTAERAAWLGNDESHYVKKWIEKDVKDLKNLIQLTVLWITTEKLTEQLLTDMPKKGK